MQKHVIGNWKMNLPPAGIARYLDDLKAVKMKAAVALGLAPPFPFIGQLLEAVRSRSLAFEVGAQNCSDRPSGAFTGEVSAPMLRDTGAHFVIVGHSERRGIFGEGDDLVRKKMAAVSAAGLLPVLCIGESLETRERGETDSFVSRQLDAALKEWAGDVVVAYEPIWAIGTGRNASAAMVAETGAAIRRSIRTLLGRDVPLLYGGSVTDDNVEELAGEGDVDGFLVGGASLDAAKFSRIYLATTSSQSS